jgi:hypothetical protein
MATARERMAATRERRREGIRRFEGIELSKGDVQEIAAIGYPEILQEDGEVATAALQSWIIDMIACLDRTG